MENEKNDKLKDGFDLNIESLEVETLEDRYNLDITNCFGTFGTYGGCAGTFGCCG
ncbi:MAG: hypothetical protein AB7W47_17405 [Calditrichaceae bacterium]